MTSTATRHDHHPARAAGLAAGAVIAVAFALVLGLIVLAGRLDPADRHTRLERPSDPPASVPVDPDR